MACTDYVKAIKKIRQHERYSSDEPRLKI